MAASPRGANELDFEAEENAILEATGVTEQGLPPKLDLDVEDSGNLDVLTQRLASISDNHDDNQIVHLSCHGRDDPEPMLIMEDEGGDASEVRTPELMAGLRPKMPRLLFLSACTTSSASMAPTKDGSVGSLSRAMVHGGASAVLGWAGSVHDWEATLFASRLYGRLALKMPLEEACSEARNALIHADDPRPSRHWHMARLWLGVKGGGPLVGGDLRRSMKGLNYGHKEFLDTRSSKSQIAGRNLFVGRRRPLQTALKALRSGDRKGLLIHGMGRQGKSSLAARIAHRRKDLELVVIFDQYDAMTIAQKIPDIW